MKVSVDDKAVSKHLRKSLLFNGKQTWMEKTSIDDDTPMKFMNVLERLFLIRSQSNKITTQIFEQKYKKNAEQKDCPISNRYQLLPVTKHAP